jgi:hypothetical protein
MAEITSNVEFAHKVHEHHHHHGGGAEGQWIEILEAVVLAIVAIATAWAGYQAAKWDAHSAEQYAVSMRTSIESQQIAGLAGQEKLYDNIAFNGWVGAQLLGKPEVSAFYERRFRPEYAVAFKAWMKLDPIHNPSAPAGPFLMKEYRSAHDEQAKELSEKAKVNFENGVSMRETGDKYVRITVYLAIVLLLTALSQRFKSRGPRVAVVAIAFLLLVVSGYWIAILPRA